MKNKCTHVLARAHAHVGKQFRQGIQNDGTKLGAKHDQQKIKQNDNTPSSVTRLNGNEFEMRMSGVHREVFDIFLSCAYTVFVRALPACSYGYLLYRYLIVSVVMPMCSISVSLIDPIRSHI